MPQTKQAKKALRKSDKRAVKNKAVKKEVKKLRKQTREAIVQNEKAQIDKLLAETIKKIDKAIQKGIIKKNTGARYKSRLMKMLNKKTV